MIGLNTTASWRPGLRWQEGVARRRDVTAAGLLLSQAPPGKARLVATHHPLLPIEGFPQGATGAPGRPRRRDARGA